MPATGQQATPMVSRVMASLIARASSGAFTCDTRRYSAPQPSACGPRQDAQRRARTHVL